MKFGKLASRRKKKEEMFLQITPMADVLVILLAFLLKSLSAGMSGTMPSQDLLLPQAIGGDPVTETIKLEISREQVVFEEKPIAKLSDFQLSPEDMEADGTIRPLNSILLSDTYRVPASVSAGSENTNRQPIMIIADANAPYATVRTVLQTLSKRGFPDLKLLVVQDK